jgi:HK97 family phage portal protein
MNISLPSLGNMFSSLWTRNKAGDNLYLMNSEGKWGMTGTNLDIAQNHPIATPAILFVSKTFSQAKFKVRDRKTGKLIKKHWLIDKLNNPNYYQTNIDFLESIMFQQIAEGCSIAYIKKDISFNDVESIYVLNVNLIKWPEDFKTPMSNDPSTKVGNKKIVYDENGENLEIKIKDLLFFYDMPNGLEKNKFKNKSRLDGLNQTLINTKDSLVAKNIILKSNGKELITGVKDGGILTPEEKESAENLWNGNYGLAQNRKRGLITKAQLAHKSLHIALRDLGLDESVKVDGNLIYTALHIPKDILSLEAKKTTYNNFKESMVSYYQNEIQSSLDAFTAVFNKIIEPELELVGDYEHLPIMQYILIERYKVAEGLGKALTALRSAGLPDNVALEKCGLDTTIKLEELKSNNNGDEKEETNNAAETN